MTGVDSAINWPTEPEELAALQAELRQVAGELWLPPPERQLRIGACFVCFAPRAEGEDDDPAWAAAAVTTNRRFREAVVISGRGGGPYRPGLMALREGALLERAVRALSAPPEVLLVNATGRDHPRRAGLALHLGAVVDIPSVGVTHRTLAAAGEEPGFERGAISPLVLDDDHVGYWLRTRPGARPIAVTAAWRTDPDVAAEAVMRAVRKARTPEPMRRARRAARLARAGVTP